MRTLLNIIWFVLGGIAMGLGWWLAGLVFAITIIGLPWARAAFMFGSFSFFPFGREAVSRDQLTGREDIGTGPLGMAGNIIWLVFAGWWLALGHVCAAVLNAITIIGIPFAVQHIKLGEVALWPIGKTVVPKEVARQVREDAAADYIRRKRGG